MDDLEKFNDITDECPYCHELSKFQRKDMVKEETATEITLHSSCKSCHEEVYFLFYVDTSDIDPLLGGNMNVLYKIMKKEDLRNDAEPTE